MNTKEEILVIDVNVIIHLEKVNLLDELVSDNRIRIVDLVMYQEYEYKENMASKKIQQLRKIRLSSEELEEAASLYKANSRNSIFDYYSYIACKNKEYTLLTGDWKLKKTVDRNIEVRGVIWYVQTLHKEGKIDNIKLKEIYLAWLEDPAVYIRKDILFDLILELENVHD